MPDLYRAVPCVGCGKTHDLYDTSAVRHAPKGVYSYTCPTTRLEAKVQPLGPPEVVQVLPNDSIPMVWFSGWPSSD